MSETIPTDPTPTRLQLGTARLEDLDVSVLDKFLDRSWIHLGDAESVKESRTVAYYLRLLRGRPLHVLRAAMMRALGRKPGTERTTRDPAELYSCTRFEPFWFQAGGRLDFEDDTFDYVFSEHFFHHLFLDEAFALFRECHRVLKPHGVLRTVVPDADLRTYAPPEPAGFPDRHMPFTAPLKHKTRYSVYMLGETLRLAGFAAVPLRYCNREGEYVRKDPAEMTGAYAACPEREFVFRLDHVIRLDSLIVDGLKQPDA